MQICNYAIMHHPEKDDINNTQMFNMIAHQESYKTLETSATKEARRCRVVIGYTFKALSLSSGSISLDDSSRALTNRSYLQNQHSKQLTETSIQNYYR